MLTIIDSHFHLWNLDVLHLPWLADCPAIAHSYATSDLITAYKAHADVRFLGGVYIEVDCDDRLKEDEYIYGLKEPKMLAKVMRATLSDHMRVPLGIAGVREPLHVPSSPKGRCLEKSFLAGLERLADAGLLFESCNRTEELGDMYEAAKTVPQATIVINHCGNATAMTAAYKRDMANLASLPNVYCKVSGFPTADTAFVKDLLHFLTQTFAPNRLIYASNYPVVSLYSTFDEHLRIVREYFNDDPDFFANTAKALYHIQA